MDYVHYPYSGGKRTGPTPVGPSGFRPPVLRARTASKFIIDQIHDAEADENVESPADDDDCDE